MNPQRRALGFCCFCGAFGVLNFGRALLAQQPNPIDPPAEPAVFESAKTPEDQRILGVIPNFKTVEDPSRPVEPMTVRDKFKLGARDSFDPYALPSIAVYAAIGQWQNQYPSLGQGMEGFAKRYGGAYLDQAIGNMLGEAVIPSLLHEDPRYFRMAKGGVSRRTGYAMSRILVIRTDSGGRQFNFAEFLGNGVAAGIANAYYPHEDRTFGQTTKKIGLQVVADAGFNVLKEFWPDIRHKLFHK